MNKETIEIRQRVVNKLKLEKTKDGIRVLEWMLKDIDDNCIKN